MPVPGGSIREIAKRCCLCALTVLAALTAGMVQAQNPGNPRGAAGGVMGKAINGMGGSYAERQRVLARLPLDRLTKSAQQKILSIAESPTIYRRLPTQAISCDRDMFLLLTRNPELLVGIWDLMGVTKVNTRRTGPYQLMAEDGSGTRCKVDLVYGDSKTHIFVADGSYDGKMAATPVRGRAVFVLNSTYAESSDHSTTVTGSLDCFIQFDSLGADLIARTLSGLIGRSADNNFIETARFIAQVSQAAERNPSALIDVARRIPQVSDPTRKKFVSVIGTVSARHDDRVRTAVADRMAKNR